MAEGGASAKADSSDSENSAGGHGARQLGVTVPTEQGSLVTLALRVRGLRAKSGFSRFFGRFSKHADPAHLLDNAQLLKWQLSESAFETRIAVQRQRKKPKKSGEADMMTENSDYRIGRFPSEILAEHTKFEVMTPPNANYSFILITLHKKDRSVQWQSFLRENGTIDASET